MVLPTQPPYPTPGRRHLGPVQLVVVPCLQVRSVLCVHAACLLCLPHVPFHEVACSMQLNAAPLMRESSIWHTGALSCVTQLRSHTASLQVAAYPSLETCWTSSQSLACLTHGAGSACGALCRAWWHGPTRAGGPR